MGLNLLPIDLFDEWDDSLSELLFSFSRLFYGLMPQPKLLFCRRGFDLRGSLKCQHAVFYFCCPE
jgi:hypothetical protein